MRLNIYTKRQISIVGKSRVSGVSWSDVGSLPGADTPKLHVILGMFPHLRNISFINFKKRIIIVQRREIGVFYIYEGKYNI